jgi:hypothetical protein
MGILADLAASGLVLLGALLFLTQMTASRVGAALGRRRRARSAEGEAEAVGLTVGGLLSLLAFVPALTLSQGSNRFTSPRW